MLFKNCFNRNLCRVYRGPIFWSVLYILLHLNPVEALIVVDGKAVTAWPKETVQAIVPKGVLPKTSGQVTHYYPHPTGMIWGLTLLVDFSDVPAKYTTAQIDAWLNQPGYNLYGCQGSVRDYWADISNGKVDFQNEIHGYYRAKNPKSYYEAATDFSRSKELLTEVLEYFDATVDYSKFDNDLDGTTEAISIAYAGPMGSFSRGLWPHAGSIKSQTRDGVVLGKYMMTNLGSTLDLMTFSHETGHMVFGWPDLYGFGDYCLMGNAHTVNPVPINDFYRADQGWIDIVDIDKNTNAFFHALANSKSGFRYLNPDKPGECFFWSNWKNVGRRAEIKGSGILMFHFDSDIPDNNPPDILGLSVVQADGRGDLNKTKWPEPSTDPFDYFSSVTKSTFGPTTIPTAKWNDDFTSGLLIHDISPIRDTMTFYVGRESAITKPVQKASRINSVEFSASAPFDIQGRDLDRQTVASKQAPTHAQTPSSAHSPVAWRVYR